MLAKVILFFRSKFLKNSLLVRKKQMIKVQFFKNSNRNCRCKIESYSSHFITKIEFQLLTILLLSCSFYLFTIVLPIRQGGLLNTRVCSINIAGQTKQKFLFFGLTSNVLPLSFFSAQNKIEMLPDLHNPFKILSKIFRTLYVNLYLILIFQVNLMSL